MSIFFSGLELEQEIKDELSRIFYNYTGDFTVRKLEFLLHDFIIIFLAVFMIIHHTVRPQRHQV